MKSNGMLRPSILSNQANGVLKRFEYKNLRKLRKDMRRQITQSIDGEIHVARSRRGNWGEWFEVWDMCAGKPRLLREGWQ